MHASIVVNPDICALPFSLLIIVCFNRTTIDSIANTRNANIRDGTRTRNPLGSLAACHKQVFREQ